MRLHELHINNFKFFPKQDHRSPLLKIDGKNLLIYGENGSGKSTIYWSIYTLLESAFKKENDDVSKYFSKGGNHGLVNIHAPRNHKAHIKAILRDNGVPDVEYYIDGKTATIDSVRSNSAIRESGMASDFINYRVIFRLHNLKHSKENNLFGWFEDEIFPYLLIANINSTESVGDVLKSLKNGPAQVKAFDEIDKLIFPNPFMQHHEEEAVRKDFKKFKKYERDVKKWNAKLKAYLQGITTRANEILSQDFQQNFEIKIDYTFSKINVTEDDLGWDDPIIELKIPKYNGKRNAIQRPHTFLNEAKWTSIGLSIRLAIIEDWTNRPVDAQLKALVIDDMLLSLDMSNRDIVLNILLDRYVTDYQLIMLTHDRSFYEFAKRKIDIKAKSKEWIYLEMFEDLLSKTPKPYFKRLKSSLQTATDYFNQHDYPACGIYLRKRFEELLKNLLPTKYRKESSKEDHNVQVDKNLNDLINALKPYCLEENIDYTALAELKTYKDAILNPLAHNDLDAPFYRRELKILIEILEKLEKIKRGQVIHHPNQNMNFTLNKPDGTFFSVRMKTKESVVLIEEDGKPLRISVFSKCKVSSKSNNGVIDNNEENFDSLKDVYEEMCNRFGIGPVQDIARSFDYNGETFDQKIGAL